MLGLLKELSNSTQVSGFSYHLDITNLNPIHSYTPYIMEDPYAMCTINLLDELKCHTNYMKLYNCDEKYQNDVDPLDQVENDNHILSMKKLIK